MKVVNALKNDDIKDELLQHIVQKVVQEVLNSLDKDIKCYRTETEKCKKELDVQKKKVRELEEKQKSFIDRDTFVTRTEEQSKALSYQLEDIEEVRKKHELAIDSMQQYQRRKNLRVFGISETKKENTDALIINLFDAKLGVKLSLNDIERTQRVGKRMLGSDNQNPRPILVQFVSCRTRAVVFYKKKLLKGSTVSMQEDLTANRLTLLKEALAKYGSKNVWSRNGRICFSSGGVKYSGVTAEDLNIPEGSASNSPSAGSDPATQTPGPNVPAQDVSTGEDPTP